ncbi:MAG: tetratricopeptide repeat protein [Thermodesulfovibrionales bacterium]
MSLKDIDKLKEKVDKDPNSKLFVPLAEEYRKEGMLEEAIGVLLSGIEKQPGYMSARVSLGKIYLEKEMLKEAQAEFEQVIRAIPDNLYAHKKLADIYRATGDTRQAIRSYKTVLKLNSMDEEALSNLSELEGMEFQEAIVEKPAADQQPAQAVVYSPEPEKVAEEKPAPVVDFVTESGVSAEPIREEDLAAFQSAIFGAASEQPAGSPADLLASKTGSYETAAGMTAAETETDEEAVDVFELDELDDLDALQKDAVVQSLTSKGPSTDVFTHETTLAQTILQQPTHEETKQGPTPMTAAASVATLADADRQVSEDNYGGALKIYRALLTANPGDRQILQRVEELRQFLKMIGKDKEALIDQLNSFMEGIEKRRDEFHRNT